MQKIYTGQEAAVSTAIASIEEGIEHLTNGNVGAALDDLLAARLLLTVVRGTLGTADAPEQRDRSTFG